MSGHEQDQPPTEDPGATPVTGVEESDPSADSAVGLAGGMGVSSERLGTVRGGSEEVTYAAAPTHPEVEPDTGQDGEALPEQSAHDGRPDVQPDNDVTPHPRNPEKNFGH